MKKNILWGSGTAVSEVGLGTAQLSNTDNKFKGVKFLSVNDAREILSTAFYRGIDYFDTGAHYGNTETLLGELKQAHGERVIIATKAGLGDDGVRCFSIPFLRSQIENSLRRINVDCLDILQLNKPTAGELRDGQLFDFLKSLKKEGKIRYAGVVVGATGTGYQCIESGEVDSLQVLYNLLYQETEDLIQKASESGLGVIVRSPLNSGLLAGFYTADQSFDPNDERSAYFSGPQFTKRFEVLQKIQEELGVLNDALLDYALRFVLSNPCVSLIIPGASRVSQVEEYVKSSERNLPFTKSELQNIKRVVLAKTGELKQQFQGA